MSSIRLGEIGKISMCKRILKSQTNEFSGIPFYKISTFGGTPTVYIDEKIYREYKEKYSYPKKGDILISAAGTIGKTVIFDGEDSYFQDSNIVWIENDESKVTNQFLYYFLQTNPFITTNGSTIKRLYNDNLRDTKIPNVPSIQQQNQITDILGTLDKKIQINNQINQELEAMAKTLYDYWFVQFDFPDQNGKPYKSSGGKMVYHPELKREIPEGWGVAKVEDIAQTGSGGTPKSTNVSYYSNGEIPWINSGELEQTVITSTSNFITEEGLNNSSAKLFPSGTILVAMYGATAGKVSFLTFEASTNQAICAIMLNDIRMRYYLKNVIEDLYQYLVKLSTGSARDNLSQDMIKNIKVVIPSNDILDRYYDFSNNIIKEITKKQQENEQLTQLRDWLLPMLMNGQVKV